VATLHSEALHQQITATGTLEGLNLMSERSREGQPDLGQRLLLAYVSLCAVHDGSRTALLARFGNYEVRLIEFTATVRPDGKPLWLELYDREFQSACDCYAWSRLSKLDEAVEAAEQLIAKAKQLHGRTPQRSHALH
jgi:hypothetical protein